MNDMIKDSPSQDNSPNLAQQQQLADQYLDNITRLQHELQAEEQKFVQLLKNCPTLLYPSESEEDC